MNTQIFIEKAREIHGDKYDYSKVEYKNCYEKVCIVCPEHGEFFMKTGNHLNGKQGCPKCARLKNSLDKIKTTEQFIIDAKKVHGNKYDYSKTKYIKYKFKICIICPEHGEFWQTAGNHLQGNGCPKCNGGIKYNTQDFIEKSNIIHSNKYDYSKSVYEKSNKKVCIICPEHGEFWQTPGNHLNGQGCPKCVGKNKNTQSFIEESNKIHSNKYDYSKVKYNGIFDKVCIICPEHGEFWQRPHEHLRGYGCKKCAYTRIQKITTECSENFEQKSMKIHGNKYDYSKVDYKNAITKVCIICPEHGEFWQTPNKHLQGQGCPKCRESNLEEKIRVCLEKHNIMYQQEKRFKDYNRRFDFYLPKYNMVIECQGIQHFETVDIFTKYTLEEVVAHDKEKFLWCKTNGIQTLYFTNINFENIIPFGNGFYEPENVFYETDEIMEYVNKTYDEMMEAYDTCNLPETVDKEKINKLLIEARKM